MNNERAEVFALIDQVADARVAVVVAQQEYDRLRMRLQALVHEKFPLPVKADKNW